MNVWIPRLMRSMSIGVTAATLDMAKSYEEAVRVLNTLQSNAALLEKARQERHLRRPNVLTETLRFSERAGISVNDIDRLSVIHVSGTKGKGSTCAFCESILRAHGYKTGFFSSPHLVEVRERIRINGRPLSRDVFTSYFWDCYKKLHDTKDQHNGAMPAYFRFLMIMAFQVFLQEEVDVAVIEVGIGGQYDSTNVFRSPVVCGVSSLGYDHMSVLGESIEEIAWNKAGIFKPGVPAYTVPQIKNSIDVLHERAKEIGCPLHLAPSLSEYSWGDRAIRLGVRGDVQHQNASLALQLCREWMRRHDQNYEEIEQDQESMATSAVNQDVVCLAEPFPITKTMAEGLEKCSWPGRMQTIRRPGVTYYLDGAHTPRSVQECAKWFNEVSPVEARKYETGVIRVLLFNTTGDRKQRALMEHLVSSKFDYAVFCPNIMGQASISADQTNHMVTVDSQLARIIKNRNAWIELATEFYSYQEDTATSSNSVAGNSVSQGQSNQSETTLDMASGEPSGSCSWGLSTTMAHEARTFMFNTIQEALHWATNGRDPNIPVPPVQSSYCPQGMANAKHIQVLVTGSLHLVGGALRFIDPDLCETES